MELKNWYTRKFVDTCVANGVEPVISGDKLLLMCPKIPDENIKRGILSLVPSDQRADFIECLKTYTRAALTVIFGLYGAEEIRVRTTSPNRVLLEVVGDDSNAVLSEAQNQVYGQAVHVLKQDPYTGSYQIRFNGKVMVDSGVPNEHGVCESDLWPEESECASSSGQPSKGSLSAKATTPSISITDNRFDSYREYLPEDVSTDVKILLGATSSVKEFLKNI